MSRLFVDAIVVGAGVIGLAVARKLALCGLETIILERANAIGTETSSRNSEVIHAGLYYPQGSLKAKVCVEGRAALYNYCTRRGVEARRVGKILLAASPEELPKLDAIAAAAKRNAVFDLVPLTPNDVATLEPELHCAGALLSPSTGIIDSHGYMQALREDFEAEGGMLAFHTPAVAITCGGARIGLTTGGTEPTEIEASFVVNAAGHGAPGLAARTTGLSPEMVPPQFYAKGNYFALSGRQPFSHLIYPMPDHAGLGVHATLDLNGRCRFGPDVEWVDENHSLDVAASRAEQFYDAIRRYWPGLRDGALQPDYAGIRPKLHDATMPMPDFRIDGPHLHGVKGLVNLFGIESPGLTGSLAIADMVAIALGVASDKEAPHFDR
ncbi:L-2-hydroxyglutarate oxidase LhgO [Rhizobium mongolense subsp. loessense]|uniref:L-2-hydroxyglutarate oxidase LhgO n=1 Tax=Rhizobium mongolense subsp. loessense TaxID=158890 RepID=A0A1G4TM32_9HYPH|nr:NAD(P)/FAD-dependent oxidoreductase [Rhizobium mongolense]SCW82362.1 L-2-hydroxyglutarate oxidase LhgO [Rhizobium mongolense subsp. loessense]